MMSFDLLVIGSGPGGYVAAIRASQLGLKTAVVEKADLGGICLNWGCIPTKALMKSAQVFTYMKHAQNYGVVCEGEVKADFEAMVKRSRGVAESMSKGIQYLLKKNNIEVIQGHGKLTADKKVEVTNNEGTITIYDAKHIILATGARSRILPNLPQDGRKIIGYREALTLPKLPESILVVGSGAIGSEFAFFYNSLGVKTTLVELLPNILPVEDEEISKQVERAFRKQGMKIMTEANVESVNVNNDRCFVSIKDKKGNLIETDVDIVLSAVGIQTNLENLGLETAGIQTEKGKIIVDDYYNTNVKGIYAIGDIVHGPALAHVASQEAIVCVEKIAGKHSETVDYKNIPGCTYTSPEVASVGMTEAKALAEGYEIKTGKFPFTASGKATAAGNRDGMIKVIFDAKTDLLLGCHMVGDNVTEMISEAVILRKAQMKAEDILSAVHPHPTMSEAVKEAVEAAYGEAIHL
ncbi:MAG: Dihydrolipoamide dehydrogenase [Bacteroidetes bacterium ADurb.Bin234]|jgi:dihydrolipoamide dehydrogenase|nr:MAG: Dihydrolipoamide dehydrogenase [Bacteroidetes bacterium ADurb.Bin234]